MDHRAAPDTPTSLLVTKAEAIALAGLRSRSVFDRLVADGRLPQPIDLGRRSRYWNRADLAAAVARLGVTP